MVVCGGRERDNQEKKKSLWLYGGQGTEKSKGMGVEETWAEENMKEGMGKKCDPSKTGQMKSS